MAKTVTDNQVNTEIESMFNGGRLKSILQSTQIKNFLVTIILLIATSVVGQSKKELREALSKSQLAEELLKSVNEQKTRDLNSCRIVWKKLETELTQLKSDVSATNRKLINDLPYLMVSEGFPEVFIPENESLKLYSSVYSLKNDSRPADCVIKAKNHSGYESNNSVENHFVHLLGVIDTTLYKNFTNVIYGTVSVLYDNKIWYATFFDLDDSDVVRDVKRNFEKRELIKEFGEEIGSKIYARTPWIGMSEWQLNAMFGNVWTRKSYESMNGTIYINTYKTNFDTYVIQIEDYKVTSISKY